jgi:hypothetical protein
MYRNVKMHGMPMQYGQEGVRAANVPGGMAVTEKVKLGTAWWWHNYKSTILIVGGIAVLGIGWYIFKK